MVRSAYCRATYVGSATSAFSCISHWHRPWYTKFSIRVSNPGPLLVLLWLYFCHSMYLEVHSVAKVQYLHTLWFALLFIVGIFIVDCAVHQLSSHSSESRPLKHLSQYASSNFFQWAVNHLNLSIVYPVLNEEELCLHMFCFLLTGECAVVD